MLNLYLIFTASCAPLCKENKKCIPFPSMGCEASGDGNFCEPLIKCWNNVNDCDVHFCGHTVVVDAHVFGKLMNWCLLFYLQDVDRFHLPVLSCRRKEMKYLYSTHSCSVAVGFIPDMCLFSVQFFLFWLLSTHRTHERQTWRFKPVFELFVAFISLIEV